MEETQEPNIDKSVEEFYTLLKSKITGRVINGLMDGCILEKELEELYESFINR